VDEKVKKQLASIQLSQDNLQTEFKLLSTQLEELTKEHEEYTFTEKAFLPTFKALEC